MKTKAKSKAIKSLPPVKQLFLDSWDLLKEGLLNLIFILISYYAASFFFTLIMIFLGVALFIPHFETFGKIAESSAANPLSMLPPSFYWSIGLLVFAIFAVLILMIIVMQSAMVLAIGDADKKQGFGEIINQSFKNIWPLLGLTALSSFLVFGGYMIFVVPGLIIAILLGFSVYEVILEKKGTIESINTSFHLVGKNFGAIFGRFLLLGLLTIGISLIPYILGEISQALAMLYSPVSFLFSFLINFYTLAYSITLYKQVKEITPIKDVTSPTWAWVLAGLGWLISILVFTSIFSLAKTAANDGVFSDVLDEMGKSFEEEMMKEYDMDEYAVEEYDIDDLMEEYQ